MTTKTLKVELPEDDVDFMEAYAKKRGKSVADLLDHYIRRLQQRDVTTLHPEVTRMTGILPEDIDVEAEYHQHQAKKHQ